MKFNEIPYERPDFEKFEAEFKAVLARMETADTFEKQDAAFLKIYQMRDNFSTMFELASIRFTCDTRDKKLEKEVDFFNEVRPKFEGLVDQFYTSLSKIPFKKELEEKRGKHLLVLADYALKGFDAAIIDDLKIENGLITEFKKLKGGAVIDFEGEQLNLAGIDRYLVDKDRQLREKAHKAKWQFFADNQAEFDRIFDELVVVRHRMGQKMGADSYIPLAYNRVGRVGRIDYNEEMVANFRKAIQEEIVPISRKLRQLQRERLGCDELEDYDLKFHFPSGNPKPNGSPTEILAQAKKMYSELSEETETFFNYLLEYDLLDVLNRPGKASLGYCWCVSNYKHPYIFANFNGTSGDIDVLTHEAGHAFQYFQTREKPVIEHRQPGSETAEIHAFSMEFLTYPWMEGFFQEEAEKYFFSHLNNSLLVLPYICAVDHFQHLVYKNPDYTPDQRGALWNEMQRLYLPDYKMTSTPYLASGRLWQRQWHIYGRPFLYIEYALAKICAFQFWQKAQHNRKEAWADYVNLCQAGGTQPFLQLLKVAKLKSPFEVDTIKEIAAGVVRHLDRMA